MLSEVIVYLNVQIAMCINKKLTFAGLANGDGVTKLGINGKIETPNVKKRHRRAKSGGLKSMGGGDGYGK